MKSYIFRLSLIVLMALIARCSGPQSPNACATDLEYVVDPVSIGLDALNQATFYKVALFVGADDNYISAKLDTGSSELIINENNFISGTNTQLGQKPYGFSNQGQASLAINAIDSLQVGCSGTIDGRFALTSKNMPTKNILGLAFGDPERLPHEAHNEPFFDQLVKYSGFKDVISLALCAGRANSHVLFGGIDNNMKNKLSNKIKIIEKSSYVVPALTLRLADSKKIIGYFPSYDPKTGKGEKTILDSGTAFNLLPEEMAEKVAQELIARAKELGIFSKFPSGFFRIERASSTRVVRFISFAQLRQFPAFEITFLGADNNIKALELSPLHYFKEMSSSDPLIRAFGFRESKGPIVLGQPFLENHYTVLDRKNGLVAFGDIDDACTQ